MSDLDEVEAAVRGARAACDLPIVATMSFDTAGRTMMGVTGVELADRLGRLGLAAMGANCGNNVADTEAAVVAIASASPGTPVISKPNAGVPVWSGDSLVYDGTPEVLAAHAHRARAAGVAVIGSCCGSTPAHTAKIVAVLRGDEPPPDIEATPPGVARTEDRMARRRHPPPRLAVKLHTGCRGRSAGPRLPQWRNWRSPVKSIAMLRSSAAAITAASLTEPPGWTTTAAPASAAAWMPSLNG